MALVPHVVNAIRFLGESNGSSIKKIVDVVQTSPGANRIRGRGVLPQVKRALNIAEREGLIDKHYDKYILTPEVRPQGLTACIFGALFGRKQQNLPIHKNEEEKCRLRDPKSSQTRTSSSESKSRSPIRKKARLSVEKKCKLSNNRKNGSSKSRKRVRSGRKSQSKCRLPVTVRGKSRSNGKELNVSGLGVKGKGKKKKRGRKECNNKNKTKNRRLEERQSDKMCKALEYIEKRIAEEQRVNDRAKSLESKSRTRTKAGRCRQFSRHTNRKPLKGLSYKGIKRRVKLGKSQHKSRNRIKVCRLSSASKNIKQKCRLHGITKSASGGPKKRSVNDNRIYFGRRSRSRIIAKKRERSVYSGSSESSVISTRQSRCSLSRNRSSLRTCRNYPEQINRPTRRNKSCGISGKERHRVKRQGITKILRYDSIYKSQERRGGKRKGRSRSNRCKKIESNKRRRVKNTENVRRTKAKYCGKQKSDRSLDFEEERRVKGKRYDSNVNSQISSNKSKGSNIIVSTCVTSNVSGKRKRDEDNECIVMDKNKTNEQSNRNSSSGHVEARYNDNTENKTGDKNVPEPRDCCDAHSDIRRSRTRSKRTSRQQCTSSESSASSRSNERANSKSCNSQETRNERGCEVYGTKSEENKSHELTSSYIRRPRRVRKLRCKVYMGGHSCCGKEDDMETVEGRNNKRSANIKETKERECCHVEKSRSTRSGSANSKRSKKGRCAEKSKKRVHSSSRKKSKRGECVKKFKK